MGLQPALFTWFFMDIHQGGVNISVFEPGFGYPFNIVIVPTTDLVEFRKGGVVVKAGGGLLC